MSGGGHQEQYSLYRTFAATVVTLLSSAHITSGTSQGLILGPTLFSVYMHLKQSRYVLLSCKNKTDIPSTRHSWKRSTATAVNLKDVNGLRCYDQAFNDPQHADRRTSEV